jgi:hypothetical protein
MSLYPQIYVRMETIGEPYTTIMVLLNEDSLATVERQLDTLEHLIAQYGAKVFWGEPDTEPPRQTA